MLDLLLALALTATPQAKAAANTICPVLGGKVDPAKSPKVVVRGKEYFICCPGCDKQLLANPDKYLEKDGTPKNAAKSTKKQAPGNEGRMH